MNKAKSIINLSKLFGYQTTLLEVKALYIKRDDNWKEENIIFHFEDNSIIKVDYKLRTFTEIEN